MRIVRIWYEQLCCVARILRQEGSVSAIKVEHARLL